MPIAVQLYSDPRSIVEQRRIATALERIANVMEKSTNTDTIDPADVAESTQRLAESRDALKKTLDANPAST